MALLGFCQGANPPANRPIVAAVVPPELRSQAFAIFLNVFETIGWAVFSLGAGILAASLGIQTVFLWTLVVLMAAFTSGKAAFFVYTTSVIASLQKSIGTSFDWMPVDLPSVGGEKGALPAGGNGWVVLSDESCRAAYSNALIGELLSPEAVAGASGTSYSYIPVNADAGKSLLASSAATPQLTYAWSYDKPLTPWGGFEGSKVAQVNDAIRLMAQQLQSGAEPAKAVSQAAGSVNAIVGK